MKITIDKHLIKQQAFYLENTKESLDLFYKFIGFNPNEYENPYLAEYNLLMLVKDLTRTGIITDSLLLNIVRCKYGYSIPTEKAIKRVAMFAPICDLGAGKGYWSLMLRRTGIEVEAYDLNPIKEGHNPYYNKEEEVFFTIKKCDTDFIPSKNYTLFLSWPPYNNPMATDYIKKYKGDYVIYIGESYGGCTGDDELFSLLGSQWYTEEIIYIPQIPGMRDYLTIYSRR